ncbi:MAG TPA: hypothetical protein VFR97_04780 [Capillimicrobium sp.]|nr:hypothetical protein [Capillimicrobium sp.]
MEATALLFAIAGVVAGLTGTWSPCGFSMIDTLGPNGHDGGRRRTAAACAAFAIGAPIGGAITFAGLSALGSALQGGGAALGVGIAIAIAAAALDGFGVPVTPQLRRQVPESWRRVLPLPLAGLLYGILLGLGFTTFVLAFALPALAAISVAVADVELGLTLGVAFGIGRALPIVALAPLADTDLGARAITTMAERPALLRGARAADALALAGVALVLGLAAPESAEAARPHRVAAPATDPSADGRVVAFSVPGGGGGIVARGRLVPAPGAKPAVGAGRLAYLNPDGTATVARRATGQPVAAIPVPGADALAVSARWLAWRTTRPERILVADLADPAAPPRVVARAGGVASLSRPAIAGNRIAWAVATRRGSAIKARRLGARRARTGTLRRGSRGVLLTAPALDGHRLLWIRTTNGRQALRIGPARRGGGGRALLVQRGPAGRDGGHGHGHTSQGVRPRDRHGPTRPARTLLLSTALSGRFAYVTRMPRRGGTPVLVRVRR